MGSPFHPHPAGLDAFPPSDSPASETSSPIPTDTPLPTETAAPDRHADSSQHRLSYKSSLPIPRLSRSCITPRAGTASPAVAARFNVQVEEITSPKNLPAIGLVDAGTLLIIPDRILVEKTPNTQIIPDSEVIFSASATTFDLAGFITDAGGFLAGYRQWITSTGWTTSTDVINGLTRNNSVNPRLLLALLEYESGWVYGTPIDMFREKYPMGYQIQDDDQGLYKQLQWAVNQLFEGYYGWRMGTLTELTFPDGETLRLAPDLNAGTVALQYFFSRQRNRAEWERVLDPQLLLRLPRLFHRNVRRSGCARPDR